MPHITKTFSSLNELVDYSEFTPATLPNNKRASHIMSPFRAKFTGVESFGEAVHLARMGWVEGARQIKSLVGTLMVSLPTFSVRKTLNYSMVGPGTLDMTRYIQGHPEAWVVNKDEIIQTTNPNGEVITVDVNLATAGKVSTTAIFFRGAAVILLVDSLERAGYRVELHGWETSSDSLPQFNYSVAVDTIIKQANAPIDFDRIAFCLEHPACSRRLMWSIKETFPIEYISKIGLFAGGGYGYAYDPPQKEGHIYIGSKDLVVDTYEDVKEWLITRLHEQGIECQ